MPATDYRIWCNAATGGSSSTASFRLNYSTNTAATTCTWDSNAGVYQTGTGTRTDHGYAWIRLGTREAIWDESRNQVPSNQDLRLQRRHAKEREKINKRADRLLKQWLSDAEYNYLMEQGQLELPSQYEKNVIYIVKKDPHSKVKIAQTKKISCIHKPMIIQTGEACIHIDSAYPTGDMLLANIALLKTDEKEFLNTANISAVGRPLLGARITQREFAGLLIRDVPGTNFWFVQFDMDNLERPDSVNHCHETARDLQFPQDALIVPCDKYGGIYNHVRLPGCGQYFINADTMEEAVGIARYYRNFDCIELERHVEDAARIAEQEYERERNGF